MDGMKHRRRPSRASVRRSTIFDEMPPEGIIRRRRLRKETAAFRSSRPSAASATSDHLFGSSVLSAEAARPSRRSTLGPPSYEEDAHRRQTAALSGGGGGGGHTAVSDRGRPLFLLQLPSNDDDAGCPRNRCPLTNGANECRPVGAIEFPPLQLQTRVIRNVDSRLVSIATVVPIATETRDDLPSDIFWLGNPPPLYDLSSNRRTARAPSSSVDSDAAAAAAYSAAAAGGVAPPAIVARRSSSHDLSGAICWLGHPVLKAAQPTNDSCRSNLRSDPFNRLLQGTTGATQRQASCRIREQSNVEQHSPSRPSLPPLF